MAVFAELDDFTAECRGVDATLALVDGDAWARQALGQWNVAQLVAHLVRAATRVPVYLPEPVSGPPAADRIAYWRYDAEAEAPAIAKRAIEAAAAADPPQLAAQFHSGWTATVEAAGKAGPDALLNTFAGPMRLDEYLDTRVLEVVVHHLDLRTALDQPPASDPAAARRTMAVLEQLLGEPRPRAMGRTRFILAATGRLPVDDPRFPVLR